MLRFKSLERKIAFKDVIHGEMEFPADHVDDFIIMRTDGVASYNFAAAVDDLLMDITHVIRGSDHLSNTPKQIMLFLAFGKEPPAYAHHSLLTGSDRKPLSKRHGATTVAEFRGLGILPEAMVNYLAIIGRKTDSEFMGRDGLVETFSLESFSSSDALFDLDKLLWLNKEHMRAMDPAFSRKRMGLPGTDGEKVAILRENARTLREMRSMLAIFDSADVEEEAVSFLSSLRDSSGDTGAPAKDSRRGPRRFREALQRTGEEERPFKKGALHASPNSDHRQAERPAAERTLPVDPER